MRICSDKRKLGDNCRKTMSRNNIDENMNKCDNMKSKVSSFKSNLRKG